MGRRSDDVGGWSQDVNIHGATRDWLGDAASCGRR